jgi:hypothetical protein
MLQLSFVPPRLRVALVTTSLIVAAVLLADGAVSAQQETTAKRPLTHRDYDGWKSIQAPVLSRDGKFLAYNLMAQEGDGELVVRNVGSGAEYRLPRGRGGATAVAADEETELNAPARPARGRARQGAATATPAPTGHQFTPDVKAIVVSLPPTKAELDRARQAKTKAEDMPRTALVILDLTTGQVTARVERVAGFTVGGQGTGLLVYKREAKTEERPAKPTDAETPPALEPGPGRAPPRTYGSDLVIRNLADNSEGVIPDVTEYTLTRDGKTLVYAVSSRKDETNGVYVVSPSSAQLATPILIGKGHYQRLTWDEKQTQLVFASDKEDAASTHPKFKVYHWQRSSSARLITTANTQALLLSPLGPVLIAVAAVAQTPPTPASDLVGPTTAGLRADWVISDRAGFSFSSDGTKLYLSTGPRPAADRVAGSPSPRASRRAPAAPANNPPAADNGKVVVDLWHWKDEYIQPMQKVRATNDQNRTYRAVYDFKDKAFRQLSDETMDVNTTTEGDWAIGADNRKYRYLTGFGPSLSDYALVNIRTGEKKPLLEASLWPATFSPKGRYLVCFDGKDWHACAVPNGKKTNLTANLPVRFVNEDRDTPSEPPAYGVSGWSADEKYVLLNDHYDIWKVAVDGSEAKLLTGGLGRKSHIVFRLTRLEAGEGGQRARSIDLSKPLLLKAENESTRDQGFFRLDPGSDNPRMLIMGARAYGQPVKARNADTLLLTISTFYDFPDYYVTDPDFREFRKVT